MVRLCITSYRRHNIKYFERPDSDWQLVYIFRTVGKCAVSSGENELPIADGAQAI